MQRKALPGGAPRSAWHDAVLPYLKRSLLPGVVFGGAVMLAVYYRSDMDWLRWRQDAAAVQRVVRRHALDAYTPLPLHCPVPSLPRLPPRGRSRHRHELRCRASTECQRTPTQQRCQTRNKATRHSPARDLSTFTCCFRLQEALSVPCRASVAWPLKPPANCSAAPALLSIARPGTTQRSIQGTAWEAS